MPEEAVPELERRFSADIGEVEDARGFLGYEPLRSVRRCALVAVSSGGRSLTAEAADADHVQDDDQQDEQDSGARRGEHACPVDTG